MGIPPTIGFYAKYQVIVAAIEIGPVGLALALAIVVLSAVSAFYYLRVVAVMYFNTSGARAAPGADRSAQRRHRRHGDRHPRWAASSSPATSSSWPTRWYRALTVVAFAGGGGG